MACHRVLGPTEGESSVATVGERRKDLGRKKEWKRRSEQGGRTESKTLHPTTQSRFLSPLIKHGLKKKPQAGRWAHRAGRAGRPKRPRGDRIAVRRTACPQGTWTKTQKLQINQDMKAPTKYLLLFVGMGSREGRFKIRKHLLSINQLFSKQFPDFYILILKYRF